MAAQRTAAARGGECQVNELLLSVKNGLTERDVFEATDYRQTPRGQKPGGAARILFSHAEKTLVWDPFAFAEPLLTQPVMVAVRQRFFGAFRDGMEI
jgi:uncharacterized protein